MAIENTSFTPFTSTGYESSSRKPISPLTKKIVEIGLKCFKEKIDSDQESPPEKKSRPSLLGQIVFAIFKRMIEKDSEKESNTLPPTIIERIGAFVISKLCKNGFMPSP